MPSIVRVIEVHEDGVGVSILQGVHHGLGRLHSGTRVHDDVRRTAHDLSVDRTPLAGRQRIPLRVGRLHALEPAGILEVVLSGKAVVHHIVLARTNTAMDGGPSGAADCDVVIESVRGKETSRDQPVEVGRDRHLKGIGPHTIHANHQNPPRLLLGMNGGQTAHHQNGERRKAGKELHPLKIRLPAAEGRIRQPRRPVPPRRRRCLPHRC